MTMGNFTHNLHKNYDMTVCISNADSASPDVLLIMLMIVDNDSDTSIADDISHLVFSVITPMMMMMTMMFMMMMMSSTWLLLFIPSLGPISPGDVILL